MELQKMTDDELRAERRRNISLIKSYARIARFLTEGQSKALEEAAERVDLINAELKQRKNGKSH